MANEIKIKRYESIILQVVNKALTVEVTNNLARQARVTYVKLAKDLSLCKIYIDCLYRDNQNKVLDSLNHISGLFRSKICEALDTYKTPKIVFLIDKSIEYAENIDKIIKSINE